MSLKKSKSANTGKIKKGKIRPASKKNKVNKNKNKSKLNKNSTKKTSGSRNVATGYIYISRRTVALWFIPVFILFFIVYLFILDQRITQRFEGRIWQLPAHVYARPLELFVGKPVSVKQLNFELEYLNYQKVDHLPQKEAQYRRWNNVFEIDLLSIHMSRGTLHPRAHLCLMGKEGALQVVVNQGMF